MDLALGIEYLLFVVVLALLENVYLMVAPVIGIIDKPNGRSSHRSTTIRGGGIIFWFAALIYFINNPGDQWYFFVGATIIAVASFIDDIHPIHQFPRFVMHFGAVSIILISAQFFTAIPWYVVPIAYILIIGTLNAYNFMDGINGITGLYSISVLVALQFVNLTITPFADPVFIWLPILANIVFLYFNFRKKALCFAGDVGSITMAFWIVYLILLLILESNSPIWILLLAVYGIDSVLTIIHRIYLKQNIFAAHRLHFYQILANETGFDHRIISSGYAIVQGLLSAVIIWKHDAPFLFVAPIVLIPLILIYLTKLRLVSRFGSSKNA
jgi:UDP-N-acetylmuramyl pentapeptide phosphotransferase/UDP-N-acetylglucosamine-1-phosphate transferase